MAIALPSQGRVDDDRSLIEDGQRRQPVPEDRVSVMDNIGSDGLVTNDAASGTTRLEVALIGAGPRGTIALERLCASASEFLPPNTVLTIHVIDPSQAGSGAVWNPLQPPQLLMNTLASQMTIFTDKSVVCTGPIRPGPSLHEWAAAAEPGLGPNDYATRAQYGRYLQWGFREVVRKAPPNVRIEVHTARAVRLDDAADNSQSIALSNGRTLPGLAAVVLSQGHLPLRLSAEQESLVSYANRHGLNYIPPTSPASVDLSSIKRDEPVLIQGLGLTFFDYMALLTEGRGGRFARVGERLVYQPSGSEPRIYAGSNRGVPYRARGDNQKGAFSSHTPKLLTQSVVDSFRARAGSRDAPNFRAEIWPLIAKEVETVYYETVMRQLGITNPNFQQRFLANYNNNDHQDNSKILDEFHIPQACRWSWSRMSQPYDQHSLTTPEAWKNWLVGYLHEDVRQARLGTVNGPLKAAIDVMRDLRGPLQLIVDHGGLAGPSRRDDFDKWYAPLNAFLAVGPPRHRIEQMAALVEAGVLEVFGPQLDVRTENGAWVGRSRKLPNHHAVRATTLIEARIPKPSLEHTADDLLVHLRNTGQCRQHIRGGYKTGGLDVSPGLRMIDRQGREHATRFVFGIPTEGVHWMTMDGARPGVNSALLRRADMVARAALRAATVVKRNPLMRHLLR
ncbi:hypothetical protein M426DRAFT_72862 [Hypoxylon sp. CI-4A]|nr:hypothetical protein M426DRAFT_72862 [Hypoxylon sp. CI-4A]